MHVERLPTDAGRRNWVVLIVDDEPDIHEITELILADVTFEGTPIILKSVFSAQQAKSFLATQADIALVLLDVVMETDDAGLSLTRYIREQLHNEDIQIILRTGQPGHAPEQDVVQNYNINGYFLKTELTAQKLSTIVISALRSYQLIGTIRRTKPFHPNTDNATRLSLAKQKAFSHHLGGAIIQRQIDLMAQPQIRLADSAVVGIELKPARQMSVQPTQQSSQLTAIMDDAESLLQLNAYLLKQALFWGKRWNLLVPGVIKVSIPIIVDGINNDRLFALLQRSLIDVDVPQGLLEFELSESMLPGDSLLLISFAEQLRERGCAMTISDFGMGLAPLLQLKKLQLSGLKIHRWLVQNSLANSEQSAVARAIIALAHTMEMNVIADGIMTQNELEFFKWEGCDFGQGSFIASAVPPGSIAELLQPQKKVTH